MAYIFCCTDIKPYKAMAVDHQLKFRSFIEWATFPKTSSINPIPDNPVPKMANENAYVIQLVRQINYGPVESKRYFLVSMPEHDGKEAFEEIAEKDLIEANYKKLNSYKNYKCTQHNKFFELNLYTKDPVNKHHWRADIARPASEIDI